ncbi:MAG: hypothetical protein A2Y62_20560 [Candidatus Fischerbacteria bacterium RBG_13_37_8]|uniref:Secretin/TonB short N-terminal domain-containing protein n=1 Tax=Candidatus Fischerbacteria bacterium RBG_13_37_8 TaxID=1817863 RepID=A0A1F5VEI2_9BACT|nr:MAG: hypothetical protein A2Y62_20560 [Candidatus Fischerbacteria bacterium RBG_13_37_8]
MRKLNYLFIVIAVSLSMCFLICESEVFSNEFSNFYWEQLPQKTKIVLEAKSPINYEVVSDVKSLDYVIMIKELDLSNLPKELVIDTAQVKAIKFFKEGDNYYLNIQRVSLFPCDIRSDGSKFQIFIEGVSSEKQEEKVAVKKAPENTAIAEVKQNQPEVKVVTKENEPKQPVAPMKPATILRDMSLNAKEQNNQITFSVDGKVTYKTFVLHNPERIVVDFYDLLLTAGNRQKLMNSKLIDKVRIAQFQTEPSRIVRAVVDVKKETNYNIVERGNSFIINIPPQTDVQQIAEIEEPVVNEEKEPLITENIEPLKEPEVIATAEVKTTVPEPENDTEAERQILLSNDRALFSNQEEDKTKKDKVIAGLKAQTIISEEKKWEGEAFTFDFKDIDIKDLFRFIADISGLNIILDPQVSGKITLKLMDVPWDQALDLICRSQGLGYALEGNVIRVAPVSVLSKEAEERRKQKEQEELIRPMQTIIRPLSYSTAAEVGNLVKKLLSPKGTIDVDTRTNTLIITDIDKKIPAIENLINSLDLRIPQVVIEARMVETSREFSQGLGIQWGFRGIMDPSYGNNTSLSFPNTMYAYGDKIFSTKGGIAGNPLGGYAVNLPTNIAPNAAVLLSTGNVLDTFRLDVALAALENQGHGRILSNPKIATQNNQQAEIRQGYQIPVQTIANNTVTTTFVNATLSLSVKPQITAEDTIIMDVTVENNRPDFTNVVFGTPPIITQRARATILMENGATAVMGGILVGRDEFAQAGVPGLSKIPIIKYLFKNSNIVRENRELLIFLTPRIIK